MLCSLVVNDVSEVHAVTILMVDGGIKPVRDIAKTRIFRVQYIYRSLKA